MMAHIVGTKVMVDAATLAGLLVASLAVGGTLVARSRRLLAARVAARRRRGRF